MTLTVLLCVLAASLDMILGLDARGVLPGDIERNVFGEASPWILDVLGTVSLATGGLLLLAASGIWLRIEPARIAGLVLAIAGLPLALGLRPTLDGWALGGLVANLVIVVILSARENEFRRRAAPKPEG